MHDAYVQWKAWEAHDFGVVGAADVAYFSRELAESGVHSVQGLKIGELGFGNGGFAEWVRRSGGRWTGREALEELNERARSAGFHVLASDETFSDAGGRATFDLLVAFDVIEHLDLSSIRRFLMEAGDALKPAGRLMLRIPSGDSPFAAAIYNGDLTHKTLLGSSAVRRLASESKFDVVHMRSPVLPVHELGFVRAMRRSFVRMMQAMVFAFIRNVLMGNRGAVLSPNMIVVLARRPNA